MALALAALVTWCVSLLRARLSIQVSAAQESYLQDLALAAASYAEQWGAAKLKSTGTAAKSDAKLRQACEYLASKAPGLDGGQRAALVESMLPFLRSRLLDLAKLGASKIPSSPPSPALEE
jgi:hypothetical protein